MTQSQVTPSQFHTFLALQPVALLVVFGFGWALATLDLHLARREHEAETLDELRRASRNRLLYVLGMAAAIAILIGGDLVLVSRWALVLLVPLGAWALYWAPPANRTIKVTTALDTEATSHQLWELLSDKTHLPEWCPGYVSSRRDSADANLYHVTVQMPSGRRLEASERIQHSVLDREIISSSQTVQTSVTFAPSPAGTHFVVQLLTVRPYLAELLGTHWMFRKTYVPAATDRQLTWMRAAASYVEAARSKIPSAVAQTSQPAAATPELQRPEGGAAVLVAAVSSALLGVLAGALLVGITPTAIGTRIAVGVVGGLIAAGLEALFWVWYFRRRAQLAAPQLKGP